MTAIAGTRRSRISPLGLTFLVVTSIGWGVNFPVMKYLLSEWPPLSSRGLTGIVGAAELAFIAMPQRQVSRSRAKCGCDLCWYRCWPLPHGLHSWVVLVGLALLRELVALVVALGGVAVASRAQ